MRKLQKKSLDKASSKWFTSFKEKSHLHDTERQSKAAVAAIETAASRSEDLAKIMDKGGYTEQ